MSEPKSAELKAEVSVYISSFRNGSTPVVISISSKDISPWRNKRFQCWVKESRIWNIFLVPERKKLLKESWKYIQRTQELACPNPPWPIWDSWISNSG